MVVIKMLFRRQNYIWIWIFKLKSWMIPRCKMDAGDYSKFFLCLFQCLFLYNFINWFFPVWLLPNVYFFQYLFYSSCYYVIFLLHFMFSLFFQNFLSYSCILWIFYIFIYIIISIFRYYSMFKCQIPVSINIHQYDLLFG